MTKKRKKEDSATALDSTTVDVNSSIEDVSKQVKTEVKGALKESGTTEVVASAVGDGLAEYTGGVSKVAKPLIKAGVDKLANKTIETAVDTTGDAMKKAVTPKSKKKESLNEDDIDEPKNDVKGTQANAGKRAKSEDERFKGHSYADVTSKIMSDIAERGAVRRESGVTGLISDTLNAAVNIAAAPVTLAQGAFDEVKNVASMALGEERVDNALNSIRPKLSPLPDTLRPKDGLNWVMEKLARAQAANAPEKETVELTTENTNTNTGPQ